MNFLKTKKPATPTSKKPAFTTKLKICCQMMDCTNALNFVDCCHDPVGLPCKTDGPVYILGKLYDAEQDKEQIRQVILTRIWATYRKGFPPIGDTKLTTDKGWGCMLRCGQMVLCEALMLTIMKTKFVWTEETKNPEYIKIIRKIEDDPSAPFSIHKIAEAGVAEGKQIGEWFGPNTVAQCLKNIAANDENCELKFHVALDSLIVLKEIREGNKNWKPLVLLVPLRLGIAEINDIYLESLKQVFSIEGSLGIIGGTPNHALYFFGRVGEDVMFLDPHTTHQAGSIGNKDLAEQVAVDKTYHCQRSGRMKILSMDPSIALCFYAKTEEDFNSLIDRIKTALCEKEQHPMLAVVEERLDYKPPLGAQTKIVGDHLQFDSEDSEFEMI